MRGEKYTNGTEYRLTCKTITRRRTKRSHSKRDWSWIVGFGTPRRKVTLWIVRLETYVGDGEVSEAVEYIVALLYEHLVRVQRAQIHVVLPRKKKGALAIV